MRTEQIRKIKPVYCVSNVFLLQCLLYCIDVTCLKTKINKTHDLQGFVMHPPQPPPPAVAPGHDGLAFGLWSFSQCSSGTRTEFSDQQLDLSLGKDWVSDMVDDFFPTHALVVLVVQVDEMLDCGFRYLFYVHFYMVQIFILTYTFQMG